MTRTPCTCGKRDCRCRAPAICNPPMDGYETAPPSGRELDALVAERVMHNSHWIREAIDPTCAAEGRCDGFGPGGRCSSCTGIIAVSPPHYSTSIADAWTVFQHCCGWVFSRRRKFFEAIQDHASIGVDSLVAWPDVLVVLRDRFPEVICQAALAAVEARAPTDASA